MDRDAILERVNEAAAHNRPLALRGAGSRSGHLPPGPETVLDLSGLRGVIDHEPRELVVSVAAGWPPGRTAPRAPGAAPSETPSSAWS